MKFGWMSAFAVISTVVGAEAARAQSVAELEVGHWVRLKGALDADGTFRVADVEVTPPEDENSLTGTVTEMLTPTRFRLLGQEVHVDSKTRWRGLAAGDLVGARIKVEGDYHSPLKLSADSISRRGEGRDAVEGRIDRIEKLDGVVRVRVLRWTALIPLDAEVESDAPIASLPLAPLREFAEVPLERRDDDDDVRGTLHWGDFVVGGQLEYRHDAIREQDLNESRDDRRDDRAWSVRLETLWQPSDSFFALASLRASDARRIDEDSDDEHNSEVVLNESYVYWRDVFDSGWDVQVGRQDFDERREWLYDQNLDAVRLFHTRSDLRWELSLSTSLSDADDRDQHTTNWLAYVSNNNLDAHLAAYVLARDASAAAFAFDDDLQPRFATHVGVRAFGEWVEDHDMWFDAAFLFGETDEFDSTTNQTSRRDVAAFGIDLGTTWTPWSSRGPRFTVGYAYGQGGDDASDTFRQTGLHDNTDKFGGRTSFRYYGELFDPELSNMSIVTLGVGHEIARKTSLDLVAHHFAQDQASTTLVDSGLRRRPDGRHDGLGFELDAVLGVKAVDGWLLEAVVGWFDPGSAFPGGDDAWLFRLQMRYSF